MKNANIIISLALVIFLFIACDKNDPTNGTDGPKWTAAANSTFGSSTIFCVTWGNGKFIAGGDNGKMAYSADGILWTAVTDSTFGSSTIRCIAWGDGKFMAGGDSGKLAYSTDGVSWTAVTESSFSSLAINGITWGSNKWVAVGRSWMAYSNADGTTWTGSDPNDLFKFLQGPPTLNAVAYNGSRFVFAGAIGGQGHGGSLASSADGISWTVHSIEDLTGTAVTGLSFGGGKWVAVTLDAILNSSNSTAWNSVEYEKQLYDITWAADKFIAVGVSDTIIYSSDGISWTEYSNVSMNSHFRGVAYNDSMIVAVGQNGVIAYFTEKTNQ